MHNYSIIRIVAAIEDSRTSMMGADRTVQKTVAALLEANTVNVLPWLSQSPDLNPIAKHGVLRSVVCVCCLNMLRQRMLYSKEYARYRMNCRTTTSSSRRIQ